MSTSRTPLRPLHVLALALVAQLTPACGPSDAAPGQTEMATVLRVGRDSAAIFDFVAPAPDMVSPWRSVGESPSHGALFLSSTRGAYFPDKRYLGQDRFSYRINSAQEIRTVRFKVEVFDPDTVATPFPQHASFPSLEDVTVSVDLTEAFHGSATAWQIMVDPDHGAVRLHGDVLTYSPPAEWSGITQLALRRAEREEALVLELIVMAVEDPPVLAALPETGHATCAVPAHLPFMLDDVDTAFDQLSIGFRSSDPAVLPPSALSLSGAAGHHELVIAPPADGPAGYATVTITVSDGATRVEASTLIQVGDGPAY